MPAKHATNLQAKAHNGSQATAKVMPPADCVATRQEFDGAWSALYDDLHEIAACHMSRERPGHLLQTTAVVHEAFFRLADQRKETWRDKPSFFAAAAVVMRRILIDSARSERAAKRGGGRAQVELHDARLHFDDGAIRAVETHDALEALATFAPEQARALEMMLFGGMTGAEVAAALEVSESTVDRRVRLGKAWLRRELSS